MDLERMELASAQGEIVQCLLDSETIQGNAAGIARQWLAGERPLTAKQQFLFDKEIKPYFEMECSRCGCPVIVSEIAIAMQEDDQLCCWCRHMLEKMADD